MATPSPSFAPLAGVRVIEFSQMVMGPTCGLILADLGADVIKVEPLKGDRTRALKGPAAGFFATYCRNKRSIALDVDQPDGLAAAQRLIAGADVMIENFRPGFLAERKLDHASLAAMAPRLIYCSLKGFLPGPYENRLALDEVVQMMAGLAAMTGSKHNPVRAGASVNDVMGGMFAVIAIQAALTERARTGRGRFIQSGLFENCAFLMGQMMVGEAVSGRPPVPYSVKQSPWAVYDLFETADDQKMFVTVVGEEHWKALCTTFGHEEWLADPRLQTNQGRVDNRDWLIPALAKSLKAWPAQRLADTLQRLGLPFAPVNTPSDLAGDPHLNGPGGLIPIPLPGGKTAKAPALPISIDGQRPGNRLPPPSLGVDTVAVLTSIGYTTAEIHALAANGVIGLAQGE